MKKLCGVLTGIIMVLLAAVAAALLVPNLMGAKNMAVVSGSMEPGIPVGSVVSSKPVDADELQIGDVITYRLQGETMVTHRITEIDAANNQVITQGDANDVPDAEPVSYDNIVGKMWFHLPFLGYISIYLKTPLGIAVVCGVVFVLILLNALPAIFSSKEEKKRKKRG